MSVRSATAGRTGLSGLPLVGNEAMATERPELAELVISDRIPGAGVTMAPPSPLAKASAPELMAAAHALRPVEIDKARRRRADSTGTLLEWLSGFPGQDWPERWASSGAEARGRDWCPRTGPARGPMTGGLAVLLCLRVLRPGYPWMLGERFLGLWRLFGEVNDPVEFTRLGVLAGEYDNQPRVDEALHALIRVMVHTGKPIAALEVTDLLAYVESSPRPRGPTGCTSGASCCTGLAFLTKPRRRPFTPPALAASCPSPRWSTATHRQAGECATCSSAISPTGPRRWTTPACGCWPPASSGCSGAKSSGWHLASAPCA